VKELKVGYIVLSGHLWIIVESGEGIESGIRTSAGGAVDIRWNPVKELKGIWVDPHRIYLRCGVESGEGIESTPPEARPHIRFSCVESGEGIERFLTRKVCSRNDPVESGEGIESLYHYVPIDPGWGVESGEGIES